jgi:hypothetical protein
MFRIRMSVGRRRALGTIAALFGAAAPLARGRTGSKFNNDLPSTLLLRNRNGIKSLLLPGYTPHWNATVPGDSNSAPVNVRAWTRYVEAAARKYSAPPFNLRYFQTWNEVAGTLSGGSPQAAFWHGPNFSKDRKHAKPYERAMQDYVERVNLPAARIIAKYNADNVYRSSPDQGGVSNFCKWLEDRSPASNERMLDWVDYFDTHWALERHWNEPNKYMSVMYHRDGYEPFRLTHRGPPKRTYNVSGRSLVVLHPTASGSLARLAGPLQFGPGASCSALRSGNDIVLQVNGSAGWRTATVAGFKRPSDREVKIDFIGAVTGTVSAIDAITTTWSNDGCSWGSGWGRKSMAPERSANPPRVYRRPFACVAIPTHRKT